MTGERITAKTKNRKVLKLAAILFGLCIVVAVSIISVVSYQNSIIPKGIVIHHSALPFQINDPSDVVIISDIHQKRGFSIFCGGNFYNIGYHYVILPNGTVVKGRPENCKGAHTVGYNNYIGICLIGDFSERDNPNGSKGPPIPTAEQLESLVAISKTLQSRYKISSDNIITHKAVEPKTECPGEKFPLESVLNNLRK